MLQLTFENLNAKMKPQYVLSLCLALSLLVGSLQAEDCCKDGETQPVDEDCTQYLYCCTGKFVLKSCGEGEYWNYNNTRCEIDDGQCNSQDNHCTEGHLDVNPSDCASYLECVNDEWVVKDCADGSYFNEVVKMCVIDSEGVCLDCIEGCTKPDADDCTQYLVCSNGKYVSKSCPDNYYWNDEKRRCDPDEGQCNNNNSTCKDEDIKANPSDCAGYLQCENGKWVVKVCADGAYYDEICKPDVDGVCLDCAQNSTKPDSSDCTQYQICVNGKYVTKKCPDTEYWNEDKSACETDNGQCNGNNNNTTCTEGDTKVNAADCAGYLLCSNNKWVTQKCPDLTYFNVTKCVYDYDGVCLKKTCDPECCDLPDNWIGPVPNNCSAFIQCVHGFKYEQNCPNNLQYNNETKSCDFPENVQCDDGSPPPSGPSAGPSGTYCESHGRCVGQKDGAMFTGVANDACSTSYVVCQCECEVTVPCPGGLVYNQQIKSCDYPANVKC